MSIKGQLQKAEPNKYGYVQITVAGNRYGADKKGVLSGIADGDLVEFEAFKNDRGYDTFKFQSLKKLTEAQAAVSKAAPAPTNPKDTYWADKEANDKAKEPRVSYYAAIERAIQFADVALRNGALTAFAKAKDTAKLEILTAFVDEQTQRIIAAAYSQAAPTVGLNHTVEVVAEPHLDSDDVEGDSKWK